MTWCKGCKKDIPSDDLDESGFCDDCVALAEAMCASHNYCDNCLDRKGCPEAAQ